VEHAEIRLPLSTIDLSGNGKQAPHRPVFVLWYLLRSIPASVELRVLLRLFMVKDNCFFAEIVGK
jgi:hypothetical protein